MHVSIIFQSIKDHTEPGKGGEIQLTDALKALAGREAMYAYNFEGKRYEVGNKLGFLEATVEFALRREDLKEDFKDYLMNLLKSDLLKDVYKEVAASE